MSWIKKSNQVCEGDGDTCWIQWNFLSKTMISIVAIRNERKVILNLICFIMKINVIYFIYWSQLILIEMWCNQAPSHIYYPLSFPKTYSSSIYANSSLPKQEFWVKWKFFHFSKHDFRSFRNFVLSFEINSTACL